jgi:hypothetical protein
MNHDRSSGGGAIVVAVLLLVLILVIGLVGVGAGFFFFARATHVEQMQMDVEAAAGLVDQTYTLNPAAVPLAQLPLSERDLTDTLEAPSVAVDSAGNVYLAYASQTGEAERTLYLARFDAQGQSLDSEPIAIRTTAIYTAVSNTNGKEIKRSLRLLPKLAVSEGKVILGWIEPNPENTTVIYYIAESTDQGATFGEPIQVHQSLGARPTFIALAANAQGDIAASWLDNRAGIQQPFAAVKLHNESEFRAEAQVYASADDKGVCPCCPTATLITDDGRQVVAFRNQLDGIRDIYVAERKLTDEAFGEAQSVRAAPTWKFDGCPHDGPTLAADKESLYVSWMDGSGGVTQCYIASRPLTGGSFSEAKAVNFLLDKAAQGNAALAALPGGGTLAVWEEATRYFAAEAAGETSPATTEGDDATGETPAAPEHGEHHAEHHAAAGGSERSIQWARFRINADGSSTQSPLPVHAKNAFQTRPAIAIAPDGSSLIAWNELSESGKQVVIVRMPPLDAP